MAGTLGGRIARALQRHAGLRVFRFFARELSDAVAHVAPSEFQLRMVSEPEILVAAGDPALDLDADRVREACARGDQCAAAFDGNRVVGYCWFATSPLPHLDGVWVGFGLDILWTYKSFVRPSHRGRGLAPALYGFADDAGLPQGRRTSIICVEAHNRPSVAAALRAAHQPAGMAAYIAGKGSLRTWCSPALRRHEVRFRTGDIAPSHPLSPL